MALLLTSLQEVITAILAVAGDVVAFIVATPLLLIPFAFILIGGAVGLFKRLKTS